MSRINSSQGVSPDTVAPVQDACACHEPLEQQHEESLECRCHRDAARGLPAILTAPRLTAPAVEVTRNRIEIVPRPAVATPEASSEHGFANLLRGTILLAFLAGGAALMLTGLLPVVTLAFVLMLVGLSPVLLWALFVFATLEADLTPTTAAGSENSGSSRRSVTARRESVASSR